MRSRAPSLHSATADALAGGLQRLDVLGHRLEHIGVGLGALGGEIAALPRADVDDVGRIRHRERRQARQRRASPAARCHSASPR